ncbi:DUF192 domain-containing protein [Hyphomicrobium sp. CS1GBMeth3]|uniref:DUF192 domain-containing protein n=1 Tax=Hyphomicrobium sp. CS1GBMeth3 TaxID=1892845 RepID=UPI000931739A|nr:DUF192 domain-containing protein [Hyphomicrobium sp. CS1GBMeth3]
MKDTRYSGRAAVGAALLHVAAACAVSLTATGTAVAKTEAATSAQVERLQLVTANGVHALDVEIAVTPEQQALGLMYRTSLPDSKGMLFTHTTPREITMWMRNTYIPLDMVFIRADGTIHRIEARTEPLSERIIASEGPVSAVLEIAGGAAERMGLKAGDKVRHPAFGSEASP